MVARIQVALLAIIATFALAFSVTTTAKADDKKGCEVCASVKDVCKAMAHCAKCEKPNEKCDYCTKAQKACEAKYACRQCKADKVCEHCKKALDENKGDKVAAAKAVMKARTFCCERCRKAGEEKAAKCDKCVKQRTAIDDAAVKAEAPKK